MEWTIAVRALAGSPFAPSDGSDGYDLLSAGSTRVTGYPVGTGPVSGTRAEDGAPVAALLLMEERARAGQCVSARPVALLHTVADGRPRSQVLCVPTHDANFAALRDVDALRAWHADDDALATVLRRLDPAHRWRVTGCEGAAAAAAYLSAAAADDDSDSDRRETGKV
ncbi:inorganic diphosphatase [Streptomyces sp. NPDC046985]|uniref:inorganic diphosphatase n=1 Tax=Streptomyces sp. NPDC046985 TaxID=3155377 RepID=UPI0033D2687E